MAFRSMMQKHWKRAATAGFRQYATATTPKAKAYAADLGQFRQLQQHGGEPQRKAKRAGNFVPVYVAVGMIALQLMIGFHTAKQLLVNSPTVYVRKKRRETLPEVVDPDGILQDSDRFLRKSFFRKLAHIQDPDHKRHPHVMADPTRGDAFAHPARAETLKSVGVDC